MNLTDWRALKPAEIERILRFFHAEVADIDITDHWREFSCFAFFVEKVDRQPCLCHFAHLDVAHINIFQHPAAHRVVLDPYRVIQPWTVHAAVLGEHISHTAGNFTANGYTAMAILHPAALDHNILRTR